jgi:hypothetical protein
MAKQRNPNEVDSVVDQNEIAALKATIAELVAPGIKGVDLACEAAVRHRLDGDGLIEVLNAMVAGGEIVEVEYVTPENRRGPDARVKSFYLPAGSAVRLAMPSSRAA